MSEIAPRQGAPRPRRIGNPNWLGLWSLYRREVKRNLSFWLESLAAPIGQAALFYAAFALGDARDTAEGQATLAFLVPGLVIFIAIQQALELPAVALVYTKYEGSIVDLLMAPLSPGEILAGHVLAGMTAGMLSGCLAFLTVSLLQGAVAAAPVLILVFALCAVAVAALLGLLVGILADTWDDFASVFTFGVIPVLFLSGVFAPIDGMPAPLRILLEILPAHHAISGFRGAVQGDFEGLWQSLCVLFGYILALSVLAQLLLARGAKLKS